MPEIFFNGPAGRIEGMYAESLDPQSPIALVLHPHPVYGGTMNNKVVYNLYKTLFNNGFTVLRINFRGVGKSMGEYDEGIGEMIDAASALDSLQAHYPMNKASIIAGFSFGAWVAMQLIMRRPEITNFIAVSPPVDKYDFSFLSPCPIPGLIVQGNMDSIVSEELVHDFVSRLSQQKNINIDYRMIPNADHFFRTKIDVLCNEVDDYLKTMFDHCEAPKQNKIKKGKSTTSKKIFLE